MFRKHLLLAIVAFLVVAASASAATTSIKVPFQQVDYVECLDDLVLISGTLHIVDGLTVDSNGGLHGHIAFQPQGVTGVGLLTGTTYRAVGGTRQTFSASGDAVPVTLTFVNNYRLIGPGPNNNFQFHETYHLTVDANGNLRVDRYQLEFGCS